MKNTFLNTHLNCLLFFLFFFGGMDLVEGRKLAEEERKVPVCEWEAPQNLNATSITPVSVTLSWDIPITGAAPGGYQIKTILDSTGVVVNTTKTYGLSKTISGLTMGTAYRFEVRSICAGNEVSNRLVSNTIITVYVDEIINTDCPETPDGYTPQGSFYYGVINGGNISDDVTSIPFTSISENNQLYYWHFYTPNNASKYTKFIIVRERPIGTFNMYHLKKKQIPGASWSSKLEVSDQSIRIKNHAGNDIAKIELDEDVFKLTRIGNSNFNVKADISCICDADSPNPSCTINSLLSESIDDNGEFTLEPIVRENSKVDINDFNIYPNPVYDQLVINFSSPLAMPFSISVINFNGSVIKTHKYVALKDILTTTFNIDVQDIPDGIYYIIVSSAVSNCINKFIKTN
jgi:hypothetical protein